MPLTLGLDLGTNSIGWALVRKDGGVGVIERCGVRIFEPSVEDGWEHTPKNKGRRDARLARRTTQRAAHRRATLREILVKRGLLPAEFANGHGLACGFNNLGDPYDLRKRALDERLEPHEIGRVLLHLCARRGFLSNRKTRWGNLLDCDEVKDLIVEIEDDEAGQGKAKTAKSVAERKAQDDEREVLEGIRTLRSEMEASRSRTLGEYLAGLPDGERKRGRYTDREMYEDEFESVWEEQAKHRRSLLTSDLKERVRDVIFHQRPINFRKGRGKCSLEPQLPRAAMARLESQRFRLLQVVNNLKVTGALQEEYPIDPAKRAQLADELDNVASMTWADVRKELFGQQSQKVKLNQERVSSDNCVGNLTAVRLREAIPDKWDSYDQERRKRLVNDLLTITGKRDDKYTLYKALRRKWGFGAKEALKLVGAGLESGYSNLSLKAINALLPHLEDGKRYDQARQAVADESASDSVKARYGYESPTTDGMRYLDAPPNDLMNPAVEKALHELRKVVNAIIRLQHGKPDVIRVELTRDLSRSKKDRERIEAQQSANRRSNERARKSFEEFHPGKTPSGTDLIKHRLWMDQGKECAYSESKCISESELFSAEVEIDHIIPYSLHPDDSYMNKVVCMRGKNREKGNRTPYQAFGKTPEWEAIEQRARMLEKKKMLPPAKARRILDRSDPNLDDFLNRQLPDTGYIGKEASKYLERLGKNVKVEVTKGGATAMLRRRWALNDALGGPTGEKNRSDHRHHALDAAVIAVTDRSVYQALTEMARLNVESGHHSFTRGRKLEMPWIGFDQDVKDWLAKVVVSHAPLRKLSGALHSGMAYGLRVVPGQPEKKFVRRRALKELSDAMFKEKESGKNTGGRPPAMIVDPELRAALTEAVKKAGGNVKAAFPNGTFPHPRSGQTIRRVRVYENLSESTLHPMDKQRNRSGDPFKFHKYDNNHHVEIFRNASTGKIEAPQFVTMMDAAKRARRRKTPIVNGKWENRIFLMSLAKNDMVELDGKGTDNLYRVEEVSAANKNLVLRHHREAQTKGNSGKKTVSPRSLVERGRKVNVSPIGELRDARD